MNSPRVLRAAIERLARNRRIRKRLPNGVHIYVSPDSQLKYLSGEFDQALVELAKTHVNPQSSVWDIGSNCGVFAFSCAGAARIVAVEPDPFLSNMLRDSSAMNGVALNVVTAAVSSSRGLEELSIAARGRASNFLTKSGGGSQTGGVRGALTVPTVTMDDLLAKFGPPTFVKIDVEGGELDVFRGAGELLGTARPTIYFEALQDADACRRILADAGYRVERADGENWLATPGA